MKNLKRILGLLLAVCILVMSLPLSALAAGPAYSDTKGHWAEKVIEKWSKYDVVHGDDGKFRPNDPMTRGEFATVLTQLLGLEEKSANPFRDITGKEWYADAVLKAHAAGILVGDGRGNSNATSRIQRQEAFVMVGRALGVVPETNTSAALAGFADKGRVSGWARPMIAALVKGGYVSGTAAATLSPAANIDRASVIQLVGATVKTYITEPGSYAADKDGFVVIKTQGGVSVSGDSAGIVVGAGSKGARVTVSSAQIKDGAKVDAPNAVVTLENARIGGVVTVSPGAKSAEIVVPAGATVEKIVTQADGVTVSGDGEVKAVEVAAGDKVSIATPGTAVTVDKDAGSGITAGGSPVKPGESSTTSGDGQGFGETPGEDGEGGGGGGVFIPPTPVYTIEYYVNGAKKETKTVTQSDTAVLPALTAPTVTGYTFVNTWYLDETCTTTPCDASKPIKELLGEGGGTTLKLYIKGAPITYTVAFHGNGATGGSVASMDDVAYNTAATLPANGFTKTGHTFQGWNTAADGSGTSYAAGAPAKELTAADGATVTLYAVWQDNTYTVTYKANEGTGADVTVSFTYGRDVTLTPASQCPFTRTGYHFNGWNTAADGSGTSHAGGSAYGGADNLTLYAQWDVNQYSISFDGNGATGGTTADNANVAYNAQVTLTANGFDRTGYTFQGWATSANGPKVYDDRAQVTGLTAEDGDTVTLYAVWEIKKFAVTFDVKGGEQVDDTAYRQVPYNTAIEAPAPPTREGYTFKGWYKETECTTPWNFAADKVTAATTLYANWELNTYTVTFDTDGGTAVDAQQVQHGEKAESPAANPTKDGYNFDTWVTTKGGEDAFDFNNTAITGSITLYAKWAPIYYTVSYDGNSNSGGTAPGEASWCCEDEPFTAAEPGDLEKTGCAFGGWLVQGADTVYQPGETIVLTGDITLVAQWIDTTQPGEITFNANGGSGSMANQTYATDAESIALTANSFTRAGYHFAYWTRSADGTGTRYEDGATVTGNPGTVTLYAQWAMDVTLRLGEYGVNDKSIAGEWISSVQANSLLSLEADTTADLTYKAAGTAKYIGWYQNYFANMEGEKYSADEAPAVQDDFDCSGNFLVFDIVVEKADKYQAGTTTVSVKSNGGEIVATDKIVFAQDENNENKQTATVVVKLDEDRKNNGVQVELDWDGGGADPAVTYNLDVSAVDFQPAPIVLGQTVTAYDDLANDKTVVGQTAGGVDLYPADLLKSIVLDDYGETVKAALKYVTDTTAEDGPGYYLTFQVNSPAMDTQPDCTVKLFYQSWEDGDVPKVVLTGDDFVRNNDKYTATVTFQVDPAAYHRGDVIMMVAAWSADNTWNEGMRGFGTNLEFLPQSSTALMLTRDANVGSEPENQHWPFLFGNSYEDGGLPAQDLFVDGADELAEKFKIEKQPGSPAGNTTVYNASGYLRYFDSFTGYATDRCPDGAPQPGVQPPTAEWIAASKGCYVPVDIVNVQGVNADHAEAKVYDGPLNDGGKLIYTITGFTRTVQTESGAGYPDSATLIQNVGGVDAPMEGPLVIVVDWDTTDPDNAVETLILNLGVTRQRPSRVRVTAHDQQNETIYGQDLNINEENAIVGTLIQTTPKTEGDSGYYLPLTFAPWNMGASVDFTAGWVLEYGFTPDNAEPVVLPGSAFNNEGKSHTVLLPVPQEVVNDPRSKGLRISADWDGRDGTPDGPNTGHMAHGPTDLWLDLSGLRFQGRYHLVSAHSTADETRLEAVPASEQSYTYEYVNGDADPVEKAVATVTLDGDKHEYKGRTAGELVGSDFRIASDDGDTYYALGLVKYTDHFNSYWFNHAPDTFFYTGLTDGFSEEHFAKQELADAGLLQPDAFQEWLAAHNNAASFGYYIVFDLEKGGLQDGGKIEIHDPAAGEEAVRTVTADDFGDGDTLPVVYQLKTKENHVPGETPFANVISISYFNTAGDSTANKEIALVFEKAVGEGPDKEILRPQPVSRMPVRSLVTDNDTQIGMELRPSKGPGDRMDPPQNFDLFGGIVGNNGSGPYNLALHFTAPDQWPMIWDPNANEGSGGEVPTPDDTVVVRITPDETNGTQRETIEITKADLSSPCVIEGVRPLSGLNIDFNWAGFDTEDWANGHFYIGLWGLVYQDGPAPAYDPNEMGTVVKSKAVTADTQTVTVGDTAIDENGAPGTPNAFGVVDVKIAYDGLYPRMTDLGEAVDHFGAFALKAPAGATALFPVLRPGMTPFQIMNDFPLWAEEQRSSGNLTSPWSLWCSSAGEQTMGVEIYQMGLDEPCTTVAIQWYTGDRENGYEALGRPVYYVITFENSNPKTLDETESPMGLYTVPGIADTSDENQEAPEESKYAPVLDADGTDLHLDGCYDAASKTWTPENWKPLRLVSNTEHDPQYAEGYYVELELLAPRALAESGVNAETVLCTVSGGALGSETIQLKKSDLQIAHIWGEPVAWLPVIVPVAASTAVPGTDHGGSVTFTVDWDGDGAAYTSAVYTLDLSKVALSADPLTPAP